MAYLPKVTVHGPGEDNLQGFLLNRRLNLWSPRSFRTSARNLKRERSSSALFWIGRPDLEKQLHQIRELFETPEDIRLSPDVAIETHPAHPSGL